MHKRRYILGFMLTIFLFINTLPVYAVNGGDSKNKVTYPQTQGKAVLLMDASSGRVLYEVNAHEHLSPASVTKIMTALLTVEDGQFDKIVKISQKAADTPESSIWLEAGERLTREQLLYACMLNSANDAAMALAESVGGNEKNFVKMMNRRAQQLGMQDTHYRNPHGLETEGHYTSAYDLALVSREALNYKTFRQVVATKTKNIPWTGKDYNRLLINQNRLLYRYDDAIGVKTGYTKQAGNCVVGAARRGSLVLIAVSLNSPSVYQDLEQMLDYGFDNYQKVTVKKADQLSMKVPVINGKVTEIKVKPEADLTVAVTDKEKARLTYKVYAPKQVKAPVKMGQVLGNCKVYVNGREAGRVDLLASSSAARQLPFANRFKSGFFRVVKIILEVFVIIFGCLYSIRIYNLRRQKKRRGYR